MRETVAKWREQATCFQLPLEPGSRQAIMRRLSALEPVLIGNVVLKIEQCDWPYPFNSGYQFYGENQLGRAIQEDEDIEHGGPLQPEKILLAIRWAERQAVNPEEPDGANDGHGRPECS